MDQSWKLHGAKYGNDMAIIWPGEAHIKKFFDVAFLEMWA